MPLVELYCQRLVNILTHRRHCQRDPADLHLFRGGFQTEVVSTIGIVINQRNPPLFVRLHGRYPAHRDPMIDPLVKKLGILSRQPAAVHSHGIRIQQGFLIKERKIIALRFRIGQQHRPALLLVHILQGRLWARICTGAVCGKKGNAAVIQGNQILDIFVFQSTFCQSLPLLRDKLVLPSLPNMPHQMNHSEAVHRKVVKVTGRIRKAGSVQEIQRDLSHRPMLLVSFRKEIPIVPLVPQRFKIKYQIVVCSGRRPYSPQLIFPVEALGPHFSIHCHK